MGKYKPLPNIDLLRTMFDYNPETGSFMRLVSCGSQKAGSRIKFHRNQYKIIAICGENYYAHRLAWLLGHGHDPGDNEIDHINCNKSDNRLVNLRLSTHAENLRNKGISSRNTSGYKGVFWRSDRCKWRACISVDGKRISLGSFDTLEEGHAVYVEAAEKFHADFARTA